MSDRKDALTQTLEMVKAGTFPADTSARDLGLHHVQEESGLPIIKTMYSAFSGSLDAAKALHEAVLPGEGWGVEWVAKYPSLAFKPAAFFASVGWGSRYRSYAETPARAWLICILKALIAEED